MIYSFSLVYFVKGANDLFFLQFSILCILDSTRPTDWLDQNSQLMMRFSHFSSFKGHFWPSVAARCNPNKRGILQLIEAVAITRSVWWLILHTPVGSAVQQSRSLCGRRVTNAIKQWDSFKASSTLHSVSGRSQSCCKMSQGCSTMSQDCYKTN